MTLIKLLVLIIFIIIIYNFSKLIFYIAGLILGKEKISASMGNRRQNKKNNSEKTIILKKDDYHIDE